MTLAIRNEGIVLPIKQVSNIPSKLKPFFSLDSNNCKMVAGYASITARKRTLPTCLQYHLYLEEERKKTFRVDASCYYCNTLAGRIDN
jgi:hypothetical protein